jgi:large subunit ribosomal protein L20
MTRVKRGTIKLKKRRSTLEKVKGYRHGRKSKKKQATEAISHAGAHAFAHRRKKKGDFRRLWQVRIGAALKEYDLSYSKFVGGLKKKNIEVDRKILSQIAKESPETFKRVVEEVK